MPEPKRKPLRPSISSPGTGATTSWSLELWNLTEMWDPLGPAMNFPRNGYGMGMVLSFYIWFMIGQIWANGVWFMIIMIGFITGSGNCA